MRLSKLKMSGFKSFVDSTTVSFKSDITGVVGPNGCGKSNVIDAVKWVLGESAAKNLRSDSIADVIFTGSAERKPAGQASVELLFDNTNGKLTGEYHNYSEISIKRQMDADGNSKYFLNGTKCRRKDITDIFLGTGLGPRSYSIIEQGIISKFVEAKPEDMRVYIEEAAGISKYKERRKETNSKIKSTKDNLLRINDLKDELGHQLIKIQRQANAAEKYKLLREEETQVRLELFATKWHDIKEKSIEVGANIEGKILQIESAKADKASLDTGILKEKNKIQGLLEQQQEVQQQHYQLNADIARLQQSLAHNQDRKSQLQQEIQNINNELVSYSQEIDSEQAKIVELNSKLELINQDSDSEDSYHKLQEVFKEMENKKQQIEDHLSKVSVEISTNEKNISIAETKLIHLAAHKKTLQLQQDKYTNDLSQIVLDDIREAKSQLATQLHDAEHTYKLIVDKYTTNKNSLQVEEDKHYKLQIEEKSLLQTIHDLKVKLASLESEQTAIDNNGDISDWLKNNSIANNPKLREIIKVTSGWEQAVNTVLSDKLSAVCVNDFKQITNNLHNAGGSVALVAAGNKHVESSLPLSRLISKIIEPNDTIVGLLNSIYITDTIEQAMEYKSQLASYESIITKSGIWLYNNFVKIDNPSSKKDNVIVRQNTIKQLSSELSQVNQEHSVVLKDIQYSLKLINSFKDSVVDLQAKKDHAYQCKIATQAKFDSLVAQEAELEVKQQTLQEHINDLITEIATLDEQNNSVSNSFDGMKLALEPLLSVKSNLLIDKQDFDNNFFAMKQQTKDATEKYHQKNLQKQTMLAELGAFNRNLSRIIELQKKSEIKQQEITSELNNSEGELDMQIMLSSKISMQSEVEDNLRSINQAIAGINDVIENLEQNRLSVEEQLYDDNHQLNELNILAERYRVHQDTICEQLADLDVDFNELPKYYNQAAHESNLNEELNNITQKIDRLGPINLTAIEEYKVESERFTYYQQQSDDLQTALDILLSAIKKIDNETKTKFKDTFSIINDNFKKLFPKMFGGGKAELYLTDKDLLETGVGIVAKPPGKKVANISVLSGGEKALTAVSLVLSIFKLNPSPFCMLDEVDAPLDDANVLRFCEVIKEMAKEVQFIVITHNKITMEMADQLSGVTMQEPGVSRLVSVDVKSVFEAA